MATLEDRKKKHQAALKKINEQEAARKAKADAQKAAAEKVAEAKRIEAEAADALVIAEEARDKAAERYRTRKREREALQVAAGQPVRPRKPAPQDATSRTEEATSE